MNGSPGKPGSDGQVVGEDFNGTSQGNTAGTATQLIVSPMPPSVNSGANFPVPLYVVAEDANGNVDPTFTGSVTIALDANPDNANLGGSLMAQASDGVAVFSDLSLDKPGIGYTLQVSSGDLTPDATQPFDVNGVSVAPTSLTWDQTQGGVDFGYQVAGEATPSDTEVALYWSSSDQFADAIGDPVYTQDIPAGTLVGTYGPFNASADALGTPPQGATYLLAVTDPNNNLGDFDPNQNVIALALGSFTPDAGGPYEISEGQSLNLDASATSNPDNLPLSYSWDIYANGTWQNGVATGQQATLDPTQLQSLGIDAAGSPYQVRVEVTDTDDGITLITAPPDLTVDPGFTPDAGGPYEIAEGQSLNLDASATSNPDNLPLTYSWDIYVNGAWQNGVATGQQATLSATQLQNLGINAAGSPYQVRVEVTDTTDNITLTSNSTQLTVAATDIVMNSVSTSNSKSVTFNYSIEDGDVGQPFDVTIYRATTAQFDPTDPNFAQDYQEIASTTIPADQSTEGTTASQTASIDGGLPPEPSHPYVLAVANPDQSVPEADYQNDSASFRIYTVAIVVPGFGYSQTESPPDWMTSMTTALTTPGAQGGAGYDVAQPFMWNSGTALSSKSWNPKYFVQAENALAAKVVIEASSFPSNAVVDVNLIGHSRGGDLVAGASQLLSNEWSHLPPQLQDGYLQLTLLDPHPANNKISQVSYSPLLGKLLYKQYEKAQATSHDPPVIVGSDVRFVSEYYQQTPYLEAPLGTEQLLNPWGLLPSQISFKNSQTEFIHSELSPPIGHSEVQPWYTQNIVPDLYESLD